MPKLISDALASDDSAMNVLREVGIDFPLYSTNGFKGTNTKWIGKIFNSTSYLYGFQQRYPDSWNLVHKIEDPAKLSAVAKALDTPEYSMQGAIKRSGFVGIYSPRLILVALLSGKKEHAEDARNLFGLTLKQADPQALLNTAMNATELQERLVSVKKPTAASVLKQPKQTEEGVVYCDASVLPDSRFAIASVWNPSRKEAVTKRIEGTPPVAIAEGEAIMLALASWRNSIKVIRTDCLDLVQAIESVKPGLDWSDRSRLQYPVAAEIKTEVERLHIKVEHVTHKMRSRDTKYDRNQEIADRMCDEARDADHYGHWSVKVNWNLPADSSEHFEAVPKRRRNSLVGIPGGGVDPIADAIQGLAKQEHELKVAIATLSAQLENLQQQLPEIEHDKQKLEEAKAIMERFGG